MKTCKNCNLSYDDNKNFCKNCGNALTEVKKLETKESAKKQVFEERLKIDPLNLEILREFAIFLSDIGIFSEAMSISLKILAIDEKDITAKRLLTLAYYKLKKYEEAIESAEQTLIEKPDDIELLKILADALHAFGKHDNAIFYCEKILAIEPSNNKILHLKAQNLLSSGRIAEASQIFVKLKKEGFSDQLTMIYTGINSSLNHDFETAIQVLDPVLAKKDVSQFDLDNIRGFLFLAYSISQLENRPDKVDELLSIINFQHLKENYNILDEQTYLKITKSILGQIFNRKQPILNLYDIEELTDKFINNKSGYLTIQTKDLQAELWYLISLKQVELDFFVQAQQSLNRAIDLMPSQTEYSKKLKEVNILHEKSKKSKKRKTIIIASITMTLLMVIVATFYINHRKKEGIVWEKATFENTFDSYTRYMRRFPNGRFSQEAYLLAEEALWQKSKETNTFVSYERYLDRYQSEGKYYSEAKSMVDSLNRALSGSSEMTNGERLSANEQSIDNIPGRFPEASREILSNSYLNGLSKQDLRIMRNEIFARHGYIFKTTEMKVYFSAQPWYRPRYNDVNRFLTDNERKNVEKISSFE